MNKIKFENVISEEMYVLVAADGSWQGMTLSPDWATCMAVIKLLHKKGLSRSYSELSLKGFQVLPVRVSMIADGTAEEGFQRAKSKL